MNQVTYNNTLDVRVALIQAMNHFVEIARQEVLVRKQFLVLKQLSDLVLLGLATLRDDSHGVVVLLAVENHIEAGLVELFH